MNEPESANGAEGRGTSPVFISYATADRNEALKVTKAIERRGTRCWISMRDVPPGANYQEAIVQSLRTARVVVLVFSDAANTSDEIKKEVSLASRYHVPVIALRLKDVEPSDAFAYELSTRQWIDAFAGWDKAIDVLVARIAQLPGPAAAIPPVAPAAPHSSTSMSTRGVAIAAAGLLLLAAGGAWWWSSSSTRPTPAASHNMSVRLSGFQPLSADLPENIRQTVDAEITAAFNVDGAVSVSTASAAAPGTAPAFTLGGTIQRDGQTIRVITHLSNERTGTTLWTNTFDYDGNEVSRIPRHIAVDAGNVVRCGLFGASTYREPLPDAVLRDYLQFCEGHWNPNMQDGRKALVPAQRVVAAVPDFSWGWAAIAGAYWKVALTAENGRLESEARASGRAAADHAVAIDARNSEALYIKAVLLDQNDWIGKEDLFKRAVAARRLDCGCEHHQYGWLLVEVGRTAEGLEQLRQANDMLALYVYTPLTLAQGLVVTGKIDEAKHFYDAAIELAPNAEFAKRLTSYKATGTIDATLLADASLPVPEELRAALLKGARALESRDPAARAQAIQTLLALPEDQRWDAVAKLLAELGATHDAFLMASQMATQGFPGPPLLWDRTMRGTLDDPGFPALVEKLGLVEYWKTTHTKPDVCEEKPAPAFCGTL